MGLDTWCASFFESTAGGRRPRGTCAERAMRPCRSLELCQRVLHDGLARAGAALRLATPNNHSDVVYSMRRINKIGFNSFFAWDPPREHNGGDGGGAAADAARERSLSAPHRHPCAASARLVPPPAHASRPRLAAACGRSVLDSGCTDQRTEFSILVDT